MKQLHRKMGWLVVAATLTSTFALTACDENMVADNPVIPTEQPVQSKNYTMILTATKGGFQAPNGAHTRALSLEGNKLCATWKKGDQIKVYVPDFEKMEWAEGGTLTAQSDGEATTFVGTLKKQPTEGYPIMLANKGFTLNFRGQKGTLDDIAQNYDYVGFDLDEDQWTIEDNVIKPTVPVEFYNGQAIVRFTLQDQQGNPINASKLTISDLNQDGDSPKGYILLKENEFERIIEYGDLVITPNAPTNEFWTAITYDNGTIYAKLAAEVGPCTYYYQKENVVFKEGNYYAVTVKMNKRMVDLSKLTSDFVVQDGDSLTGTLSSNHKVSIAAGAKVILHNATIGVHDSKDQTWSALNCLGNAEITLSGTNTLNGGNGYAGLYIPQNSTLTIKGNGTLTAKGGDMSAGIGGEFGPGYTGTSSKSCGNIVIEGGTITAYGGYRAAGIGGCSSSFDNGYITIKNTVTKVTAYKGDGEPSGTCIGFGYPGGCGKVTIGGVVYWDPTREGNDKYQNGGETYLTTSPLVYQP